MRVIRASEIGEYVFCRRSWWLRHVLNHPSANVREMAHGARRHEQHGARVTLARVLWWSAWLLIALAVLGGLGWWFLG